MSDTPRTARKMTTHQAIQLAGKVRATGAMPANAPQCLPALVALLECIEQMRTAQVQVWTQTPPTAQGTYWHWNGDAYSAPLPMFVLWSGGSGKCFVSQGQLGITEAVDCEEYGGWWAPLYAPTIVTDAQKP